MSVDPVISATKLRVAQRLAAVSFDLAKSTTLMLTGPNGSGKSTVLDAILGLTAYEGTLVNRSGTLAIVPQRLEYTSALPITVAEFLALTRTRWPIALGLRGVAARIDALLAEAGLSSLRGKQVGELSGGELRRLLLADALERKPEVLLLDEPETGLDVRGRAWLVEVMRTLPARGYTTLCVTHDAQLATLGTRLCALEPEGPT